MTERRLLMIPGPIEFEPEVLRALAKATLSHVDPDFIRIFGRALARLRDVFLAPTAQPFVVPGSGTLAMEMAVMNVVEPGDGVLVVDTGYFSDRIAQMAERQGARVTRVSAGAGVVSAPSVADVERAISAPGSAPFKAMTITHVDTSTGVRADVEGLARLARAHGALSIVDGVCATGAEVLRQDAWGVDIAFTASQKALGVPPGLAILLAGPRALAAHRNRKAPPPSMYADFAQWLPIMQAYEGNAPAYFATPAVNLVAALDVSLGLLLAEGMEARFDRHRRMALAFRAAFRALGLRPLPASEDVMAHSLSAEYYPDGVDARLVARVREEGVVIAGGLHPDLRTKYFRVGHMGAVSANDLLATVGAIERGLAASGYANSASGRGLAAAQATLSGFASAAPASSS